MQRKDFVQDVEHQDNRKGENMIDVGSANIRAYELCCYAGDLRMAYSLLEQYQSEIESNWQAQEVAYYVAAINNVQQRINRVAGELESVAGTVSSTASQIRAEEEECARREAEERARREAEERARREAEERARQEAAAAAERARQAVASAIKKSAKKKSSAYTSFRR